MMTIIEILIWWQLLGGWKVLLVLWLEVLLKVFTMFWCCSALRCKYGFIEFELPCILISRACCLLKLGFSNWPTQGTIRVICAQCLSPPCGFWIRVSKFEKTIGFLLISQRYFCWFCWSLSVFCSNKGII